jgi:hypothetical protein
MTANMPDGAITPSADVATNAVTLAVTRKRNKINVATHQSGGPMTAPVPDETPRRWVRIAAGVVIGLVTIAGVFFPLMRHKGGSSEDRPPMSQDHPFWLVSRVHVRPRGHSI